MSNCFTCGRTFNGSVKELLKVYKQDYQERGTERYFYKEHDQGDIKIVKKTQFKTVFKHQIQPNFKNGAEYAHIKEYNPQKD